MKKVSFAAARIYMSCIERRAKLRKPPAAMQSNPYSPRESLPSSPHFPFPLYFFISFSLSALSLSPSVWPYVRVFRARLRFRSLDAEGRLIVAPFLSAAFTAVGNPSRRKNEDRSGRGGTIDFSAVHVTTDQLPLSPRPWHFASSRYPFRVFSYPAREKAPLCTRKQWAFKAR